MRSLLLALGVFFIMIPIIEPKSFLLDIFTITFGFIFLAIYDSLIPKVKLTEDKK